MNKAKIVVHCSDSKWGNAAIIDSWHKERGFLGRTGHHIGYHYVILNGYLGPKMLNKTFDGHIETGRPLDDDHHLETWEMGAHVKGHNTASVGICMIGKSGEFTIAQLNSLVKLIKNIKSQYESEYEVELYMHSDLDDNKPFCPGINKSDWMKIKNACKFFE